MELALLPATLQRHGRAQPGRAQHGYGEERGTGKAAIKCFGGERGKADCGAHRRRRVQALRRCRGPGGGGAALGRHSGWRFPMKGRAAPHHLLRRQAWTDMSLDVVDQVGGYRSDHLFDNRVGATPVVVEYALNTGNGHPSRQHNGTDVREHASQVLKRLDRADLTGGDAKKGHRACSPGQRETPRFSMMSLVTLL